MSMFGLFGLVWLAVLTGMMVFFWKLRGDEELVKKVIKWRNDLQGVETKITTTTTKWVKFSATLGLIIGVVMLLMFFSVYS
mgnify:CR=1 FL=1